MGLILRTSKNYRDRHCSLFYRESLGSLFDFRFRPLLFDTEYKILGFDTVFFARNAASAFAFFFAPSLAFHFACGKVTGSNIGARDARPSGISPAVFCFLYRLAFVALTLAVFFGCNEAIERSLYTSHNKISV